MRGNDRFFKKSVLSRVRLAHQIALAGALGTLSSFPAVLFLLPGQVLEHLAQVELRLGIALLG